MGLFHRSRKPQMSTAVSQTTSNTTYEKPLSKYPSPENPAPKHILPTYEQNGKLVTKGINPEGESGRAGFHPFHFFRIALRSATKVNMLLNILWPFVPAAIAMYWARRDSHVWIFTLSYIGMVPAAGLLGFAGQEFARKLPRVAGIITETFFGGVVEIVLFMILIVKHQEPVQGAAEGEGEGGPNYVPVIQAAILGSILANLLLCLGGCFVAGGIKHKEQTFHPVVSEVGSGLLLVAGFALLIPSAFYSALQGSTVADDVNGYHVADLQNHTRSISHATSIILIIAFFLYLAYSAFSHDSIFDEVLAADEENDRDRHKDLAKSKFTLLESIVAICLSLACISLLAYFLVVEIEPIVTIYRVPDTFMGLILVPLVEKVAEHLTAIDEAYDNQINFALFHCLGPSIQTALFNAPLVVIVGWGLRKNMDLNFEIFTVVLLVLSILVVGNFLRDGSSNYLEGSLLIIVYVIIAVAAYNYPNVAETNTNAGVATGHEKRALELARRMIESGMLGDNF